jgi:hypothetical protein
LQVLLVDKTGTLTRGVFVVTRSAYVDDDGSIVVTPDADGDDGDENDDDGNNKDDADNNDDDDDGNRVSKSYNKDAATLCGARADELTTALRLAAAAESASTWVTRVTTQTQSFSVTMRRYSIFRLFSLFVSHTYLTRTHTLTYSHIHT